MNSPSRLFKVDRGLTGAGYVVAFILLAWVACVMWLVGSLVFLGVTRFPCYLRECSVAEMCAHGYHRNYDQTSLDCS